MLLPAVPLHGVCLLVPPACREAWLFQQLAGRGGQPSEGGQQIRPNLMEWTLNKEFAGLMNYAKNPMSPGTVFLPGSMGAYEQQARAQCMDIVTAFNLLARDPSMPAEYTRSMVAPQQTLNSTSFEEGKVLQTWHSDVRLKLGRRER